MKKTATIPAAAKKINRILTENGYKRQTPLTLPENITVTFGDVRFTVIAVWPKGDSIGMDAKAEDFKDIHTALFLTGRVNGDHSFCIKNPITNDIQEGEMAQFTRIWTLTNLLKAVKTTVKAQGRAPEDYDHKAFCTVCGEPIEADHYDELLAGAMRSRNMCFTCNFWQEHYKRDLNEDKDVFAIIKGKHYIIAPDDPDAFFQGMGGAAFRIRFKDGREIVTHNLWHQGEIPTEFREKMPDNAEFLPLVPDNEK